MGLHGKIHPEPAQRLTLRVLTQIVRVDDSGRLVAVRELVAIDHNPERFPTAPDYHAILLP